MNATVTFFESLAKRKWKENDLSDVTYAALQSSSGFRQFFLDYFFSDYKLKESDVVIEREHATALGRPDFWIIENLRDGNKRLFIVEVKIWDRNHHFDQYYDILNGDKKPSAGDDDATKKAIWSRLGYISNYKVDAKVPQAYSVNGACNPTDIGCRVKTWYDFAERLNACAWESDSLSQGFLAYLKAVCPHDDFKLEENWEFNPSDFAYIREFAQALRNVAGWTKGAAFIRGSVRAYNRSSRQFSSKWRMGQYFEYANNDGVNVWGWMGAYYDNAGAKMCIEFEDTEGWGKVICDQYRKQVSNGTLRFYSMRWSNGEVLKQLCSFWQSVMSDVFADRKISSDGGWTFDESRAAHNRQLLSMKALPVFLESVVLADNEKLQCLDFGELGQFKLTIGEAKGDQEVPEGHCGRYFELRRIDKTNLNRDASNKTEVESVRGWIGAMYNLSKGKKYSAPCLEIELDRPFATLLRATDNKDLGWYADAWGWTSVSVGEGVQSQKELCDMIAEKFLGLQSRNDV